LAGRAAQPPEFSLRDVVGLTWSPLAILPPSRLAALIRPFLEPNFPRRWSDSDVAVNVRPSQPGRSLPNPAPGPLPSSLFFLRPFVFDVFAEDDDGLVNDGQPPAKRRRRASSASSSVRIEQARTLPVVNLPHDVELHTGFARKEETIDGHEWQARRIIGERQTSSGLEYEVSLEKTMWLPKATLDTKLVQSGAAGSDQSPHEVVVAVAGSGQLGETAAPVVDRGLVEEDGLERWPLRIWAVQN
jgi:hypothetical protein